MDIFLFVSWSLPSSLDLTRRQTLMAYVFRSWRAVNKKATDLCYRNMNHHPINWAFLCFQLYLTEYQYSVMCVYDLLIITLTNVLSRSLGHKAHPRVLMWNETQLSEHYNSTISFLAKMWISDPLSPHTVIAKESLTIPMASCFL